MGRGRLPAGRPVPRRQGPPVRDTGGPAERTASAIAAHARRPPASPARPERQPLDRRDDSPLVANRAPRHGAAPRSPAPTRRPVLPAPRRPPSPNPRPPPTPHLPP